MRWLGFAFATVIIIGLGTLLTGMNATSECFPDFPDFDQCLSDKRRDAIAILVVTVALSIGNAFLIFRRKRLK